VSGERPLQRLVRPLSISGSESLSASGSFPPPRTRSVPGGPYSQSLVPEAHAVPRFRYRFRYRPRSRLVPNAGLQRMRAHESVPDQTRDDHDVPVIGGIQTTGMIQHLSRCPTHLRRRRGPWIPPIFAVNGNNTCRCFISKNTTCLRDLSLQAPPPRRLGSNDRARWDVKCPPRGPSQFCPCCLASTLNDAAECGSEEETEHVAFSR